MSSSSSAPALNRSRSLRQPTAGLTKALAKDGTNVAAVAAAASSAGPARNTSPSRLPKPPGGSSIATRTRAGTAGKASGIPSVAAAGTKSRPTSGIFGRSDSIAARKPTAQAAPPDQTEPSKSARPAPIITSRLIRPSAKSISTSSKPTPASSEPSPTTPSRPSPSRAIPPTTTSSPSPARTVSTRATTHIRAKSSATALNSATVLRPPRPPSAGSAASTSTTATAETAASKRPITRSNTTAARSGHLRQASVPSSNTSALGSAASANAARPVKPTVTGDAPRLKPAFNTLQQHYSPARNLAPKPLTSSYLAPPSPSKLPANIAISSETAKLQTELLQLHLLHRDADAVTASWHASARQRLGLRFAELARRDKEARKEEAEQEEARNLAALVAWGGSKGLDGRIQVLDSILSGVWSLGEPSGRYTRVVRKFEKWADQTRRAVEARRLSGGLGALMDDDKVGFVAELDPAWKDEVSSMARKLDSWRRQLGQLESGVFDGDQNEDHKSSLSRLLSGCRSQVHGMLAELDLMEQIKRDALAQETAWIRRMNRDDDESDTLRAGAIWRAL